MAVERSKAKMQEGFKNLVCPLCLNMMYKCTTAACGHSFCEKCLDEYLIIKKVCHPLDYNKFVRVVLSAMNKFVIDHCNPVFQLIMSLSK
jgi:hypothetical protein